MLNIKKVNNINLISAWDLGKVASFNHSSYKSNYIRWLNSYIFPYAIHGYDYFSTVDIGLESPQKLCRRKPVRYIYFSVDFAITICYMMKSKKSIIVRNYLIQYKTNENKPWKQNQDSRTVSE